MESHCSLIKSFARRSEESREMRDDGGNVGTECSRAGVPVINPSTRLIAPIHIAVLFVLKQTASGVRRCHAFVIHDLTEITKLVYNNRVELTNVFYKYRHKRTFSFLSDVLFFLFLYINYNSDIFCSHSSRN